MYITGNGGEENRGFFGMVVTSEGFLMLKNSTIPNLHRFAFTI